MTRNVVLLTLALHLASPATATWAQQSNTVPVVGMLMVSVGPNDTIIESFRRGLRDLGYVEGRDVKIEFRTAQGHVDRLPNLAQELVQLKVDAIVAGSEAPARAAKQATSTIRAYEVIR